MEVVPAQRPAFQRSDVQEWSRLDQLTGVLERGRMQKDHWASGSRRYDKAVDSRVRSLAGSNVQQRQHKQLEVFQSQGPGGSLQVVRSSLTTSSSSSGTVWRPSTDFENLQLPLNPLDSSPQKTRASVGRSGSIGARRPPTRVRHLAEKLDREELEIEVPTPTITPDDGSEARQKSSSTEDLEKVDDEEDDIWRRSAKIRRSLQFSSKAPALRTDSALKGLEALENVFRRGANIADSVNKTLAEGSDASGALDADSLANHLLSAQGDASKKASKRHSFVTVESLKEVRDRLRPLNGFGKNPDENDDDGIVTEDVEPAVSRVKSYVYGMEALTKKPIPATGSLESRSSNGRSEEWYNRRKSYGFEQMQGQEVSFRAKGRVESSTDSGICRSTETVTAAAPARKTVVTLGSDVATNGYHHDAISDPRRSSEPVTITIPITSDDKPKNVVEEKCLFYRQISEGTSVSVENSVNGDKRLPIKENGFKQILNSSEKRGTWNIGDSWKEAEPGLKRHSIAVDDTRFVKEESPSLSAAELARKFDSLHLGRKDTVTTGINIAFVQSEEKRHKKVEFCKTEVHFVADSGRVNIVETDEKPPPTTMFRRRRRATGVVGMTAPSAESGVGNLPETRFGDSPYEKQLLGGADDVEDKDEGVLAQVGAAVEPKSILKNYHKPRPFHLGEDAWGVKLRPVNSSSVTTNGDGVVWKSSVSVRSTTFDTPQEAGTSELQKLLRSLRPAQKKSDGNDSTEEGGGVQVKVGGISSTDVRRPWSVADRVRQVEEMKGFSTKVNFGAGEATVVAAEEPASPRSFWLAKETPVTDEKKMSNGKEGLVVRIGERERSEKEEMAKKTTTITIDLKAERGGRSLQAPGLIMRVAAPSQLAALKQLYSASDDSADEEVRSYMGGDDSDADHDRASEVSGSWSRVRALRNVAAYRTGTMTTSQKAEDSHVPMATSSIPSFDQAKLINSRSASRPKITSISLRYEGELDSSKVSKTDQRRYTAPSSSDLFQTFTAKSTNIGAKANTSPLHREYENCALVKNGVELETQKRSSPVKYSHVKENGVSSYDDHFSLPEREAVEVATKNPSPEIFFQPNKQTKAKEEPSYVNVDLAGETQTKLTQVSSRFSRETTNNNKNISPPKSPTRDAYKINTDTYIKEDTVNKYNWKLGSERKDNDIRLSSVQNECAPTRQGLSNEFSSSKGVQKSWKEVQRMNNSTVTVENKRGNAVSSRSKRVENNKDSTAGPVYENTEIISREIKKSVRQRNKVETQEHDSSIMEELTRAADEILRAVNGYTDDESNRASSEDDDHDGIRRNKRSRAKVTPNRKLGTIAEAPGNRVPRRETVASSAKRKPPTSSTSSVESVRAVSSRTARLLQRASSREKLLQRRASSSEDADADPRKTRVSSRPQHRKPTEATRLKERTVNKRVVPQHRNQHDRSGRATTVKKDSQDLKAISTRRAVDKVPGNNPSTARDRRERQSAVPSCATKKVSSSSRSEGNLQTKVPNKV